MLGIDPGGANAALLVWAAAASAALIAALCVLVFSLPQTTVGAAVRAGAVVLGAIFGAVFGAAMISALTWGGNSSGERRLLEGRAQDLTLRALAPTSPLACLDALTGDNLATACERDLFASPAAAAAAVSYTAARFALLAELTAYRAGGDTAIDAVLLPLRRALEADRFGFLAHVLATRDGCSSENCKALVLLGDAGRVRANLSDATLQHYLDRYQPLWSKSPDVPVAASAPSQLSPSQLTPSQLLAAGAGSRRATSVDFPSAASIPAVSIMNPEPKGPVLPGVAAAAAANPNPPPASAATPPRRAHRQPANPPPPQASSGAPSAAVEPIWPEPVPQAPARTTAAPTPPEASAATVRSQ
jgi:hypothetical protein